MWSSVFNYFIKTVHINSLYSEVSNAQIESWLKTTEEFGPWLSNQSLRMTVWDMKEKQKRLWEMTMKFPSEIIWWIAEMMQFLKEWKSIECLK